MVSRCYVVSYKAVMPNGTIRSFSKAYSVDNVDAARKALVDDLVMNTPDLAFRITGVEEFVSDGKAGVKPVGK